MINIWQNVAEYVFVSNDKKLYAKVPQLFYLGHCRTVINNEAVLYIADQVINTKVWYV
jgi:hypothetical protein